MDCREYIADFVSAHADDELADRERRAAEDHLQGCERCARRYMEERQLKALISAQAGIVKVPADVRLRIRAALGEASDSRPGLGRRRGSRPAVGVVDIRPSLRAGGGTRGSVRRVAMPIAALASIGLIATILLGQFLRGKAAVPRTPAFDFATTSFDSLSRNFVPNVDTEDRQKNDGAYYAWVVDRDSDGGAADESYALARAYRDTDIPEDIYNFEAAGYGLDGGRIGQTAEGRKISYTLYRSGKGDILSICMHAPEFSAPVGARYWSGTHSYFEYQGHSICLTFHPADHYISILVAREPVVELLRDVTVADHVSSATS
jgi:hypothetical protein